MNATDDMNAASKITIFARDFADARVAGDWAAIEHCASKLDDAICRLQDERDALLEALRSIHEITNEEWHVRTDCSRLTEIRGYSSVVIKRFEA
jgi:hypothetical protein